MAKRKLILDVDTGTDDAVAIMCAALHPESGSRGVHDRQWQRRSPILHQQYASRAGVRRPRRRAGLRGARPSAGAARFSDSARRQDRQWRSWPGTADSGDDAAQAGDERRRLPDRRLQKRHRRDRAYAGRAAFQHRGDAGRLSEARRPRPRSDHHGRKPITRGTPPHRRNSTSGRTRKPPRRCLRRGFAK